MLFRFIAIGIVLLNVSALPTSVLAADVQAFFEGTRQRLAQIAATTQANRLRGCDRLVAEVFAVPALARAVASSEHWSVMRAEARDQLTRAVSARLGRECVLLIDRADPSKARIGRVREVGGGVKLTVLIPDEEGKERVVIWSLVQGGGMGWTATDLSVDGRGAAATLRQDFESALVARHGLITEAVAYFAAMGAK